MHLVEMVYIAPWDRLLGLGDVDVDGVEGIEFGAIVAMIGGTEGDGQLACVLALSLSN